MKKHILTLTFLLFTTLTFAQSVTISPSNGSKLIEAKSTNKAVQMPSVSATSAITSPQKGMVVFDDATGTLSYFNGSQWVPLSNSTTGWAVSGSNLNNTNSGNVGVGTATPLSKLHVSAGASGIAPHANAKVLIEDNANTYLNINTPDANEGGILFGRPSFGATSGGIFYSSARSLQFRTSTNNTRMVISEPGFVGIGITAPLQKLHIHESATGESNFLQLTNTNSTTTGGLLVGVEGSGKSSIYELSGNGFGINVGGVSLDLKPSLTGGNAIEISEKGVFSDLLPNVNIVPLAIGEYSKLVLEENISDDVIPMSDYSNQNFNAGSIITSTSITAVAGSGSYRINFKFSLNNTTQNQYSKLMMLVSDVYFSIKDFSKQVNYNYGTSPYVNIEFAYNPPVINSNKILEFSFVLYGIK